MKRASSMAAWLWLALVTPSHAFQTYLQSVRVLRGDCTKTCADKGLVAVGTRAATGGGTTSAAATAALAAADRTLCCSLSLGGGVLFGTKRRSSGCSFYAGRSQNTSTHNSNFYCFCVRQQDAGRLAWTAPSASGDCPTGYSPVGVGSGACRLWPPVGGGTWMGYANRPHCNVPFTTATAERPAELARSRYQLLCEKLQSRGGPVTWLPAVADSCSSTCTAQQLMAINGGAGFICLAVRDRGDYTYRDIGVVGSDGYGCWLAGGSANSTSSESDKSCVVNDSYLCACKAQEEWLGPTWVHEDACDEVVRFEYERYKPGDRSSYKPICRGRSTSTLAYFAGQPVSEDFGAQCQTPTPGKCGGQAFCGYTVLCEAERE